MEIRQPADIFPSILIITVCSAKDKSFVVIAKNIESK
jgi:hypothetical protein